MPNKSLNLKDFKRALNKYSRETVDNIAKEVHGRVVTEVYKNIVERTPVLTGRARRNWNVSFNAPNPETTEDVAGVSQTGEPWTAQERERVQNVVRNIQFAKVGSVMYISNHLPYIYFLEHGSSMKAPDGIVEGAIIKALADLKAKKPV